MRLADGVVPATTGEVCGTLCRATVTVNAGLTTQSLHIDTLMSALRVQGPWPNKGMQVTGNSLCSSLAPAVLCTLP
jgi:hypothetical protein